MNSKWTGILLCFLVNSAMAQTGGVDFAITSFDCGGGMGWGNAFTNGVCTVDAVANLANTWRAWKNFFSTNLDGNAGVPMTSSNCFYRARAWDPLRRAAWIYELHSCLRFAYHHCRSGRQSGH